VPERPLIRTWPNPCRAGTTIERRLPAAARVELAIYSAAGERLRTLVAGHRSAGRHNIEWDGRDHGGSLLPSGLYFCRLTTGEGRSAREQTAKLELVR